MLLRKVWKKYPISLCRSCRKKKGRNYVIPSFQTLYLPFTLSLSAFKDLQIRQLNIYLSYATLNVALSENQTNESRNSLLKNVFIVQAPQTQSYYITFYLQKYHHHPTSNKFRAESSF